MTKLISISKGFITNSSSLVYTINFDTYCSTQILCNKKYIKSKIEKHFNEFAKNDLHLDEYLQNTAYKEFLENVKNKIFEYAEKLCEIIDALADTELTISSEITRDGSTIDIDYPEDYAMFFIVKYVLSDCENESEEYET